MLKLGVAVPPHVLVSQAPGDLRMRADRIEGQSWQEAQSPFEPRVAQHRGRAVLSLAAGVNGGFEYPGLLDTRSFAVCVIWASPDAVAKSLLAVRKGRGNNYLYLHEDADGSVSLQDDGGTLALTLPPQAEAWHAVLIECREGRYTLSRIGGPSVSATAALDLPHPASLLIGCRAMRQGMARSLGDGQIAEVLVWHGAADTAALADYIDWEYR
ncbi:LamG domain-containing protein [Falsirhodobacter xinxiangensis]|uniref:LamG domain-containing protein n=1 Tax=Falsirhodobacter xinxiangensis TaxID=2530049 RepID=UPI0010AAFC97|nr:LamG domain-containing protein [Rhodobacter xinxiangensis]